MSRPLIDYLVLDALADDIASIESIARAIAESDLVASSDDRLRFGLADVGEALSRCVRDGLVQAYAVASGKLVALGARVLPAGDLVDHWYGLTAEGSAVHRAWV
jgi:hypothetical protein